MRNFFAFDSGRAFRGSFRTNRGNTMKKPLIQIHIALTILALHLAPIAAAGPLDTWSWRNPEPTGSYLSGVASGVVNGNSQFVAVG